MSNDLQRDSMGRPIGLAPGKGLKGQNCNVTHCQKPDSAHHYNIVVKAWYCKACAKRIEACAKRDGMSFYPSLSEKGEVTA